MPQAPSLPSPAPSPPLRLAVIGGGLTGAAVARHARERLSAEVTVFDKGRAPGGRLSTREVMGARFDMGAPLIHAQSSAWCEALMRLPGVSEGVVRGEGGRAARDVGALMSALDLSAWSTPVGTRTLVTQALTGAHLVSSAKIEQLDFEAGEWWLTGSRHDSDERAWGPFDWVVLTIPGPQAARLMISHVPEWGRAALKTPYSPQWSVAALFERSLHLDFEVYIGEVGAPFAVCRRAPLTVSVDGGGGEEGWVLQSSPAWARTHLELPAEMAAELLVAEWARVVGPLPARRYTHGHRWRYSRVEAPCAQPLLAVDLRLGVCGDWRSGPHAGDAYLGAVQLIDRIAESL